MLACERARVDVERAGADIAIDDTDRLICQPRQNSTGEDLVL